MSEHPEPAPRPRDDASSAPAAGVLAAWLDGRLVDPDQPQLLVTDRAITVGEGVFETLVAVDGAPFAVRRHLERLRRSAAIIGLSIPTTDSALLEALAVVVAATGRTEARLRVTVTGGPGAAGTLGGGASPTVLVTAGALSRWAPAEDVVRSPWPRNERAPTAGAKTTAYADNIVVARWAAAQGAGEALLANLVGNLCEGTGSNVFVEVDGTLATPPLSDGCLGGVTRDLLLELGVAVERSVPFEVLDATTEAFLSSTTRHVHPIASIDGSPLPACPGPLTQAAAGAFAHLFATTPDP